METKMDVNTAMIMVSPETAKYFLSKSIGNYRFSGGKVVDQAVVAKYAAEMKNGNWKISPQGIVFDENDHLIDGHHRLHAVIKANTTVCMAVITNAPEECVEVLDSGVKRTAHLALEYTQGTSYAFTSTTRRNSGRRWCGSGGTTRTNTGGTWNRSGTRYSRDGSACGWGRIRRSGARLL